VRVERVGLITIGSWNTKVILKQAVTMSKFELQEQALQSSGVSVEESEEATKLQPSLFERLGEDGFKQLSTLFYDRVFEEKEADWFLNIFSSSTRNEAIDNQVSKKWTLCSVRVSLWLWLCIILN
jgi:hypothetical protein